MQYKILLLTSNNDNNYYKYYKEDNAAGDWTANTKEEAVAKLEELLKVFSENEISLVINLDINTTIDILDISTIG